MHSPESETPKGARLQITIRASIGGNADGKRFHLTESPTEEEWPRARIAHGHGSKEAPVYIVDDDVLAPMLSCELSPEVLADSLVDVLSGSYSISDRLSLLTPRTLNTVGRVKRFSAREMKKDFDDLRSEPGAKVGYMPDSALLIEHLDPEADREAFRELVYDYASQWFAEVLGGACDQLRAEAIDYAVRSLMKTKGLIKSRIPASADIDAITNIGAAARKERLDERPVYDLRYLHVCYRERLPIARQLFDAYVALKKIGMSNWRELIQYKCKELSPRMLLPDDLVEWFADPPQETPDLRADLIFDATIKGMRSAPREIALEWAARRCAAPPYYLGAQYLRNKVYKLEKQEAEKNVQESAR